MSRALLAVTALGMFMPTPALAGATDFTLVNGAGTDLSELSIRRSGSSEWKPLTVASPTGSRNPVKFQDPDCAFDIRAKVQGKVATWSGVNLCETKSVTLNRNASGVQWVDYD